MLNVLSAKSSSDLIVFAALNTSMVLKSHVNYKHALELDKCNGNTLLFDANVLEHEKICKYNIFINK